MSYELNESDVRMYAVAGKSLNKEIVEAKQSQGSGSQGGQHQDAEKECTMAPSLVDYLREHASQSIDDHVESLMDLKNSPITLQTTSKMDLKSQQPQQNKTLLILETW